MDDTAKTQSLPPVKNTWQFRRDITVGAVIQLFTIIFVLIAAWGNLQRELVSIKYELKELNKGTVRIQDSLAILNQLEQDHELRIKILENQPDSKRASCP